MGDFRRGRQRLPGEDGRLQQADALSEGARALPEPDPAPDDQLRGRRRLPAVEGKLHVAQPRGADEAHGLGRAEVRVGVGRPRLRRQEHLRDNAAVDFPSVRRVRARPDGAEGESGVQAPYVPLRPKNCRGDIRKDVAAGGENEQPGKGRG